MKTAHALIELGAVLLLAVVGPLLVRVVEAAGVRRSPQAGPA